MYVVNWIESSPKLSSIIRVSPITGYRHDGGMETSEQLRVLEGFRNGTYNLLASTSVLEEGFDVPECNYIIRFQNISNEIAQVQSKGRARAESSRFYTVVSANSNGDYRYLVQEVKQRIVVSAIEELQQRSLISLQEDISRRQREFIRERDRKMLELKMLRSKWPDAGLVEIRCKKCKVLACKGSDVFTYTLSCAFPHYIVPSEELSEKYDKATHDKPKVSEDFVKPYKMYCNSPNCRNQWGVIGLWKDTGYTFPVLRCDKFHFRYKDAVKTFKKWGDIWFEIQSIQDWAGFEDDIMEQN